MHLMGYDQQTCLMKVGKFISNDDVYKLKCMHDKCILVATLLHAIYELYDHVYHSQCITGIAHVLVDDDNFDDDTIQYVKNNIDKSRIESSLILLLCDTLDSMTYNQRVIGYALASDEFSGVECYGVCSHCKLENIYE